ncbi:M50 family metallopeptidase [Actinomyces timonensis]|uniref:M50 family metallopeptidase n=1 Tax=Actinomyces timonensis TaxID=1288391 RepID=UPI0002DDBF6E|nr:site-2 protease family protein [Actinomyces timonensis]
MTQALAYALGILVLVIGIGISVALHELGHMIPAKRFGVKVPEYFIGFGPRVWSTRRGETEYGVKWIWLGGYVKLVGMIPPARADRPDKPGSQVADARADALAEIGPGEEHRAFYRLSVPRKLVVMAGGILTNLVLGIVLLAIALGGIGAPGSTTTLKSISTCLTADVESDAPCGQSDPASPAAVAGLQAGDEIRSWDGARTSSWKDVQSAIAASGTRSVPVVVERDGAEVTLTVTAVEVQRKVRDSQGNPVLDADGNPTTTARPYVGITPTYGAVPMPVGELPSTIGQAVTGTLKAIVTLPVGLYHAVSAGLGHEERSATGVIGLVGVGRIAGEVSSAGTGADTGSIPLSLRVAQMLMLLGSLNLALFAFNLIPLLPLDGGHVAGALWEGARRRWALAHGRPDPGPVDTARLLPVGQVVFGVLIVMTVILVWVDLVAPITG